MQRKGWRGTSPNARGGLERATSGIATDGADFIAFFLRQDGVVEVGSHHTEPTKPRALLEWLQHTVAVGDGLLPDPKTIKREFGRKSLAARRALDELSALWAQAGQTPGGRLKYELWSRLLRLAYGAEVGDDDSLLATFLLGRCRQGGGLGGDGRGCRHPTRLRFFTARHSRNWVSPGKANPISSTGC